MKKVITSLLALVLIAPGIAFSHPGGPGPGPDWGRHDHGRGQPAPFNILPDTATAILVGGLTYYLLNGIYYQRQGNSYIVAEPPEVSAAPGMRVLDYNGARYYVQDGHYYKRTISGEYIEVPRPAGL